MTHRARSIRSIRSIRSAVVVAAVAAAGVLVAAPPAAAAASPGTPDTAGWVRSVPVCAAPEPGRFGCLAQVLQRTATRTAGSVAADTVPLAGAGPAGGFTPAELATVYGVDPATPTTQVVAVVAAFGNPRIAADLATFDRRYGLPPETSTSFVKYDQRGRTRNFPPLRTDWASEQTLDVQAVRGMCHACRILLVQADSDGNRDLAAAENTAVALGATVVTNSFGEAEPVGRRIDPVVAAAFDHPGVVVLAGSGDDGWDSWDLTNGGAPAAGVPFYPASLASVVAVGGTSLLTNPDGTRSSETVWNSNGPSNLLGQLIPLPFHATGGGCSGQVRAPQWQRALSAWPRTGCGAFRLSADVAAVGDPSTGYDVYNSYATDPLTGTVTPGWQTAGGTSLSGPLVAGIWALAGGGGGVPYPAASLYAHLSDGAATRPFDVVAGGNGWCGGDAPSACRTLEGDAPNTLGRGVLDCAFLPGSATPSRKPLACTAAPGYDGPSGVGTPHGLSMFRPVTAAGSSS